MIRVVIARGFSGGDFGRNFACHGGFPVVVGRGFAGHLVNAVGWYEVVFWWRSFFVISVNWGRPVSCRQVGVVVDG